MFDEYAYGIGPRRRPMGFGRQELRHIALAVGALTLAFTLVISPITRGVLGHSWGIAFLFSFIISFVVVVFGFLAHELAHKYYAIRYGARAEFRAYPMGLLIAVVLAFLGVIFAAPGAVYIQGYINRRQNGIISLAGPATNLAIGAAFLAAWIVVPAGAALTFALRWIGTLSVILAAFNLLPIPPLDGYKVARWNLPAYLLVFGASIVLALIGWGIIQI